MALSSDSTWRDLTIQDQDSIATKTMVLKDSSTVYFGSICTHDTDQGYVKPFDGTQTDRFVGWHWAATKTGDTSASPKPVATIKPGGFIVRDLTVAGIAGTYADYGAEVYATDDGTYTIVDPGSGKAIGEIVADEMGRSSGKAHVFMFDVRTITR